MNGNHKFWLALIALFILGGIAKTSLERSAVRDCAAAGKTFESTSTRWSYK